MKIKEELEALTDGAILNHSFTPYMRDYQIVVEVGGPNQGRRGQYKLLFTHCVQATFHTEVDDQGWRES